MNKNNRVESNPTVVVQRAISHYARHAVYRSNKRKRNGKIRTIEDFEIRRIDRQQTQRGPDLLPMPKEREVFYYFSSDDESRRLEALDYLIVQMKHTTFKQQYLACVYGLFKLTTQNIVDNFEEALDMLALQPMSKVLPVNEVDEFGLKAEREHNKLPLGIVLIWLICHIMILYKNITSENYPQFMKNRLRALRAKLGMTEKEIDDNFLPYEKAKWVRESFGASANLKRELIYFIIRQAAQGGMKASAFGYLQDILAYNELNGFVFVYEMFLMTGSPILNMQVLVSEVRNMRKAMDQICACPYPQFYRYLCSADEEKALYRNNFPTLLAAAQKLRTETFGQSQMRFFASAADTVTNPLVDLVVKKHNAFMRKSNKLVHMNDFIALTSRHTTQEEPLDPKIHEDIEGGRLKAGVFSHAKEVLEAVDEANRRKEAGQAQELPEKRPETSTMKQAPKSKKPKHQYSRMSTRSTKGKAPQPGDSSSTDQVQALEAIPAQVPEQASQILAPIEETEDAVMPENVWDRLPSVDALTSLEQNRKENFKKHQKAKRIPFSDPSLVCEISNTTTFELEVVSYSVNAYDEMVMRFVEQYYRQLPEPKDFDSVICLCHKAVYFVTTGQQPKPSSKCKMTLASFSEKGLSSLISTLSFVVIPAAYSKSEDIFSEYPAVERKIRMAELRKEHYRLWYLSCFFSKIIKGGFASVEPIHPFMIYDEDLRRYLNEIATGSHTVDCLQLSSSYKPVVGTNAATEEDSETDDDSDADMDVDLEPVEEGMLTDNDKLLLSIMKNYVAGVVEEVENRITHSIPKDHTKKLKSLETTVGQIESNLRGALTQINQLGDAIKNIDVKFARFMASTGTSSLKTTADVNKTLLAPTAGASSTAKSSFTNTVNADALTAKLAELASKPSNQATIASVPPANLPKPSSLEGRVNAVIGTLLTPKLNLEKMEDLKHDLVSVYNEMKLPDAQKLVNNEKFKHFGTRVAVAEALKKKMAELKG